jgi:hypothetical protein
VPAIPGVHSQVRRLRDAEEMARDAISLALEVPADSFDVHVFPHVNEETDRAIAAARAAQVAAAHLRPRMVEAVQLATAAGVSMRDIAEQLDVSFQYVSKLAAVPTPLRSTDRYVRSGASTGRCVGGKTVKAKGMTVASKTASSALSTKRDPKKGSAANR